MSQKIPFITFAPLSPLFLLKLRTQFPGKPDNYSFFKNQVMKKIKILTRNENVQAGLVIAGFVIVFSLLAIFFM